jgi:PAS domain S-box/PAS domain S-box/PAS domain S-box
MIRGIDLRALAKYKEVHLGATILFVISLAVYVNIYLGIEVVYTHLFYIPVILAGIWYGRKAVLVALFLGLLNVYLDVLAFGAPMPESLIQAIIFVGVGLIIGTLSETRDRLFEKLELSDRRLNESLSKLANVVEFYPDATLITDNNGRVVAWNKAMEDMTGIPAADMIGKGDHEYSVPFYGCRKAMLLDLAGLPEEELKNKYESISYRNGKLEAVAIKAVLAGREAVLYATAGKLYDDRGNVTGAIESIREVTGQYRMEETMQSHYVSLKAQHEKLAELWTVIEHSPSIVMITDARGRIEYVNPKYTQVSGYTLEEVAGNDPHKINASTLSVVEIKKRNAVLRSGSEWRGELSKRRKNGEPYWVSASVSPVKDKDGVIAHYVNVEEDITDMKRTEEALKKVNEELSLANVVLEKRVSERTGELAQARDTLDAILQNVPIGVVVAGQPAGQILYQTPKVSEIMGGVTTGLVGGKLSGHYEVMFPDGSPVPPEMSPLARSLYHGERVSNVEMIIRRQGGPDIIVLLSSVPVMDRNGNIAMAVASILDITDRKRSEKALRESEVMSKALLNSMPGTVIWLRKDGTITDCKTENEGELFRPSREMIGSNIYDILPVGLARTMVSNVKKALKTGTTQTFEYQVTLDGKIHHQEARCIVRSADELILFVRDFTARRQTEVALSKAIGERDQVIREVTEQVAEERNALKSVADSVPAGIFTVDAKTGNITYYNRGAWEILGGPVTSAILTSEPAQYGFMLSETVAATPDDLPIVQSLRFGERVYNAKLFIRRYDSMIVPVLFSSATIKDHDGEITGAIAFITETSP